MCLASTTCASGRNHFTVQIHACARSIYTGKAANRATRGFHGQLRGRNNWSLPKLKTSAPTEQSSPASSTNTLSLSY